MTEMVTGVDLIAEQIRAAQGEVLHYKQEDIQLKVRQCSVDLTYPFVDLEMKHHLLQLNSGWVDQSHNQNLLLK